MKHFTEKCQCYSVWKCSTDVNCTCGVNKRPTAIVIVFVTEYSFLLNLFSQFVVFSTFRKISIFTLLFREKTRKIFQIEKWIHNIISANDMHAKSVKRQRREAWKMKMRSIELSDTSEMHSKLTNRCHLLWFILCARAHWPRRSNHIHE